MDDDDNDDDEGNDDDEDEDGNLPLTWLWMFQLDRHVAEECPKTKMTCEYEAIGCSHRVSKQT